MSPASPVFVVFNIGSGHGDSAAVRAVIEAACADAGRELHLSVVDDPKRITEIADDAVARARQADGIVVAAGGDGTINAVAQATLGSGCAFGVVPQGTFNYFSRTHAIPADPQDAMRVVLNGQAQSVQVGLVNDRVFLVNASLGLYPKLLEDREAWKARFGRSRLVAFAAGLTTLLSGQRSLRLRFESQGQARDVRTPTLFVGNNALQLEQLGLPEARVIEAGELAAVALMPVGRLSMLWLLLRGAFGQLGDADKVVNFSFRHLTVNQAKTGRARRIKVATDGEIAWLPLPLEFRVSPEPLLLMRP